MSVVEFPPRSTEERVIRFALAAIFAAQKGSAGAVRRCRKRKTRAMGMLKEVVASGDSLDGDPALAPAAAQWLRQGCETCKRCEDLAVTPRPRGRRPR